MEIRQVTGVVAGGEIESPIVTVEGAARYLGIGRSTMYGLLANGTIPSFKITARRKVRVADLDAYIERCRQADGAR